MIEQLKQDIPQEEPSAEYFLKRAQKLFGDQGLGKINKSSKSKSAKSSSGKSFLKSGKKTSNKKEKKTSNIKEQKTSNKKEKKKTQKRKINSVSSSSMGSFYKKKSKLKFVSK